MIQNSLATSAHPSIAEQNVNGHSLDPYSPTATSGLKTTGPSSVEQQKTYQQRDLSKSGIHLKRGTKRQKHTKTYLEDEARSADLLSISALQVAFSRNVRLIDWLKL